MEPSPKDRARQDGNRWMSSHPELWESAARAAPEEILERIPIEETALRNARAIEGGVLAFAEGMRNTAKFELEHRVKMDPPR